MKIPNKRELKQIALNHSSNLEFKNFIKLYKDYCGTFSLRFSNKSISSLILYQLTKFKCHTFFLLSGYQIKCTYLVIIKSFYLEKVFI